MDKFGQTVISIAILMGTGTCVSRVPTAESQLDDMTGGKIIRTVVAVAARDDVVPFAPMKDGTR